MIHRKSFIAILAGVAALASAHAEATKLRIQQLIPDSWIEYPLIEPALPDHYQAKELPMNGVVVWGAEDAITGDPDESKEEAFAVILSGDVIQTGPTSFSCEEYLDNMVEALSWENFKSKKLSWGDYPVLAIQGDSPDGATMRVCWVGLNSPNGFVVAIQHHHPKGQPGTDHVWNTFLHQTTKLSDYELFKAKGLDMQEGYTDYSFGGSTVRFTVEKRRGDDVLAIKVETLTPGATFEVDGVREVRMGSEWKYGEPCTKIAGSLRVIDGPYGDLYNPCVVTVLTREVDTLSGDASDWTLFE